MKDTLKSRERCKKCGRFLSATTEQLRDSEIARKAAEKKLEELIGDHIDLKKVWLEDRESLRTLREQLAVSNAELELLRSRSFLGLLGKRLRVSPISVKPDEIVTIHKRNGKPDGVRVHVGDEDFIIALRDAFDGEEKNWNEATELLAKEGKAMFSKKQGFLIAAYIDDINEALQAAGGTPLCGWYWTSTEDSATYAWLMNFGSGYVGNYTKATYSHIARPVAAVTD